ncbi:MerR family transcriptional regulator [Mycolicibacterium fortuitum]|uniref:MerR family transcriptional regulator n=1 Tax=Mycolicibacterium fortuitum TaxID=1766 RepID=UPI0014900C88|nr:MerR family transcriptional regulator [Mycolicibacterium fortuitum]
MNQSEPPLLDIGEVARRTGLAPSALRFYERKNLVSPAARTGLRRAYTPDVLQTLALITAARAAGFTLAEISKLLAARPDDHVLRERLAAKADELDRRVTQLTAMRDSLRHATACRHDPLTACPNFLSAIQTVT